MNTFLLVSAIQGYLISIAMYRGVEKSNRTVGNYFLLLITIVSTYLLINSQKVYFQEYPRLFFLSYVLFFLYSPIYYLFVRAYLGLKKDKLIHYLICFVPALVYLTYIIWNFFLSTKPFDLDQFNKGLAFMDLISISINYYLFYLCWVLLRKGRASNKGESSKKRPFYIFTIVFSFINSIWLLFILPFFLSIQYQLPLSLETVYVIMSIIIYVFTYSLIVNKELMTTSAGLTMKSYAKTDIKKEELFQIEKTITDVLSESKLYKNHHFSLTQLSKHTSIDKLKLSYTINQHMKTTFNKLINKYRVEEFIKIYNSSDFKHYDTIGVANEAGFKSKSTFYKAFKEITGKTPKDFFQN